MTGSRPERAPRRLLWLGGLLLAAALGLAGSGCGDINAVSAPDAASEDFTLFVRRQLFSTSNRTKPVCLEDTSFKITSTGSEFTDFTGCKVP